MSGELHAMSEAIGQLRASVDGLRRDMQEAEQRNAASASRADEHRAAVHRRVDDVAKTVVGLTVSVAAMQADVASSKEMSDQVRRWRQMGLGALGITGIAASFLTTALTYFWADIARWWRG